MSRSSWRLRTATPADRETVARMLREAGLPDEGLDDQFAGGYVVAERGGDVVGAGGVEVYGRYGLLRSVVVREDERGRGLGEVIVDDRLRWSARSGLRAVYLLTTTVPGFFEKVGFTELNRLELPAEILGAPQLADVCPASAVAMVLRLDPLC